MNWGITAKIGAIVVGLAFATSLGLGLVGNRYAESLVSQAETNELRSRFDQMQDTIAAVATRSESLAAQVAAVPGVAQALEAGDRQRLLALTQPQFKAMAQAYGMEQMHFHSLPATSFLRVHKPEKYGDDLSRERPTVVRTNTLKTATSGLEFGATGLSVRGVVPVIDEGRHVGSVEVGLSFGQPFFTTFKKTAGVDVALHLKNDGGWKMFASTIGTSTLGDAELASALAGGEVIKELETQGGNVAVYGKVIKDFSDKPIGVVEIVMDATPYALQLANAHRAVGLAILLSMVFSIAVGIPVARRITGPIHRLTALMDRVSNRDFAFQIDDADRKDEIGHLARGVQVVRDSAEGQSRMETEQKAMLEQLHAVQSDLKAGMSFQLQGVVQAAIQSNEANIVIAQMLAGIRQTAQESQGIAAAIEELVASVTTIAQNSEVAATEAGEAEAEAREGVGAAGTARAAAEALTSAVEDVGGKIHALAEATGQIGAMAAQIEDIAAQTNLLALNATIEAARAGDAGKGFAVVANEVKGLANQTARATDDIRARIDSLRQEMDAALAAMSLSSNAAEQGRGAVGQVTGRLDAIAAKVDGVTGHMRDIAEILAQQTQASTEVSSGTARIAHLSQVNSDQIEAVLQSLGSAAKVLDARVEDFATKMGAEAVVEIAKNDHTKFKRGIFERLADRNDLTAEKLANHHSCRLGKWYDNVTDPKLKNHPAYAKLLDPHQRVHAHGKRALELHDAGKLDEAFGEANLLNDASHEVIALLDELGRVAKSD